MRLALLFALALSAAAQTPTQPPKEFLAVGASAGAGSYTGWGSYAHLVSADQRIYSFTTYDVSKIQVKPFLLQTSVRTGVAIYMRSIGPIELYGLGDAGVSYTSTNVGSALSGGGMAALHLGKTHWSIIVPVRVLKTAQSSSQTVYEIGIGWGQ